LTEAVPLEQGAVVVPIQSASVHGPVVHEAWNVAVEVPVQISINGTPFTVLLASPLQLDDLARGLLLSEQIIDDVACVSSVEVSGFLQEYSVNVTVPPDAVRSERLGARSLLGNSGCGLCGIEALAQLQHRPAKPFGVREPIADSAVLSAVAGLTSRQPLNALTHSVHAAAWCGTDGTVRVVREDVGRHNALDKVIGALALNGELQEPGFLVLTSRCSYELIYKAISANAQLLVTIGAPTSMALQWAASLGLPVAALWQQRALPPRVVRFPSSPSAPTDHARG
jgi:FdhD protein